MIHSEIPEGYEIEWREDPDFSISTSEHRCGFRLCKENAVAILHRTCKGRRGKSDVIKKWKTKFYCCPSHMYGREIRDGRVMVDCLKEASRG